MSCDHCVDVARMSWPCNPNDVRCAHLDVLSTNGWSHYHVRWLGSCTWEGDRREGHCSKWSGWERETWQSLLSWKKIIAWYCKSSAGSQHQVVCFFFGGIFNFWDPPFLTQPLECWQAFHGSRNYLDPNLYWSRVFRRGALGLIQWIRFTQVPGKRFLRDMLHFVDTH